MNTYQELEVKILNIDNDDLIKRLNKLNAIFVGKKTQTVYTYDCYSPILMYELAINDFKLTKSKNSAKKISNVIRQLTPIFIEEDKKIFKKIFNTEDLNDYILNNYNKNGFLKLLTSKEIKNIIKDTKNRFFKWIRLRQSGEKTELTIKYIYSIKSEYSIDDVKEIEILVDNFQTANDLIEEMGYFRRKLIKKHRTSYKYNNIKIEIDEWPLIKPYVEIEGNNEEDIYKLVELLGYKREDCKIMNTDDVYILNGLCLDNYEVLTFDEQVTI